MRFMTPIVAAGLLGLAACVTTAPPPPATLTFERSDCTTVDLARAISLTPEKERALHSVTAVIDGETPCATIGAAPAAYALFAIPEDFEDKTLTVGATLEMMRILSPAVAVLDAEGRETRRFPADEFMYRGANYTVLFRPRLSEKFVLVSTEASRVGQRYDSIAIGTNTTSTYSPYAGTISFTSGVDSSLTRTFSYEGSALVVINDSDTKEEAKTSDQ